MELANLYKEGRQDEFIAELFNSAGEFTLTRQKCISMFARKKDKSIKYRFDDDIFIDDKLYKGLDTPGYTTVGIYITNKFLLEEMEIFGYVNKVFDGKVINAILDSFRDELLSDEQGIPCTMIDDFLDKAMWFWGGPISHFVNPTTDSHIMSLPKNAKKLRDELFAKYDKELEAGDAVIASKIEEQVLEVAKKELRAKSSSMALYDSNSGLDMGNNYKTVYIMKGAVKDNREDSTKTYNIIRSNYNEGLSLKDFAANADSMVSGNYVKGKMTGISGYYTKKYNAMFNIIELEPKGSDCKTKKTVPVYLNKDNIDKWGRWHYMVEDGKLIRLTPETIKNYIGKTVNMRTPICCEAKAPRYCNICYGDMAYKMEQTRVGATFAFIPNTRMNASLKKFHDIKVKIYKVGLSDIYRFVN